MSEYFVLHVITPLHAGAGQGIGGVELPVARQKPTNFPYIPGSTLKGGFRARLSEHALARALFGPPPEEHDDESAGAVFFGDAQLVAMPVRHKRLTFVWLLCPRLLLQAERAGLSLGVLAGAERPEQLENDVEVIVRDAPRSACAWIAEMTGHDCTFVDERVFGVSDDDFAWASEFLTQVDVRNRIELDTGVVVDGALWSEESLAPETLLLAPLERRRRREDVSLDALKISTISLGGKNTIGRGLCHVTLLGERDQ